MKGPEWHKVRDLFERALEHAPEERAGFLAEACDEAELRRDVDALLAAHERPGTFMAAPVADVRAVPALVERAAGRAAEEDTLPAGTVLDAKYRVEALVGRGGMGTVYRTTQLNLQRMVALKLMRGSFLADPTACARFEREALAIARLNHPNIVIIHDVGVAAGVGAYIVMEYVEGHSLRQELDARTRLGVCETLGLMGQVCAAVAAAHRAQVVHRDLKPENILLEAREGSPIVKVLDFGLAKVGEAFLPAGEALMPRDMAPGTPTLTGAVLGTPGYLSPERCRGEAADARSDVYALGCVLYEMLTGERPFKGKTVWALVDQHVNDDPPRASQLVPDIDPALEEAILGALAKDPAQRPQTVGAFARAVGVLDAARGPTNLPHAVTRFVGRAREIREVRKWLTKTRLVSLVGPGGIGKTRLAIETAALMLGEYPHGVWLVELAGLADASLVAQQIASALGVREQSDRPVAASLDEWLRGRQLLLVLDNCEHLVEACARHVERLLRVAPGLRVLATSREALGVAGEAVWPVPALSLPTHADQAFESEAARLFVDRAALVRPGFGLTGSSGPVVLELCRRLEGIPLAIELAAARVEALTLEQVLERLDGRLSFLSGVSQRAPTRHQALQATLDWSYDLLTEAERALFRRLSAFAGGWELEAVEAVCAGDGIETSDVLNLLARLVDKSLVRVYERDPKAGARYEMLEMLREYGLERLVQSGEAHALRRRHAEYFTVRAEEGRRAIWEGHSTKWLERLEVDHDNMRVALAWLLEHDPDSYLRLAVAVNPFRELRGHLTEARRCLETALARGHTAPASLRVRALTSVGMVAANQGDAAAARQFFEQGLALAKEEGNATLVANLTYALGTAANVERDLPAARAYLGESLALARGAGNDIMAGQSLNSLGEVARLEGDSSAAREFYEQAVVISRRAEHDHSLIVALCNLGAVLCERADLDAARACYAEALTTSHALGSRDLISLSADGLGAIAAKRGAWERAARLAGAAEALLEAVGAKLDPLDSAFRERYLDEVRAHLDGARFEAALAEGRTLTVEEAVRVAVEDSGR